MACYSVSKTYKCVNYESVKKMCNLEYVILLQANYLLIILLKLGLLFRNNNPICNTYTSEIYILHI